MLHVRSSASVVLYSSSIVLPVISAPALFIMQTSLNACNLATISDPTLLLVHPALIPHNCVNESFNALNDFPFFEYSSIAGESTIAAKQ